MRKLRPDEIDRPSPRALAGQTRHPIVVVLDNLRSAYNVGSIFRTADAAGIDRIVITGYTPTPEHRSVAKTALGAEDTVPWTRIEDPMVALSQLRSEGVTLAALEQTTAPTPFSAVRTDHFPLALILGNEVEGVQDDLLDACDLALEIPQFGAKHSLNVSVAFGIAAYGLLDRLPDSDG